MFNRLIPLVSFACLCGPLVPAAHGASVTVQLFPYTGEARLVNPSATPFSFVFYSLSSAGGTLNGSAAVWKSITDVYDASGNGFIDPTNNWLKLSSTSTQLAEGVIPNPGGTLPAFRAISLGNIWNPNLTVNPDVTSQVVQADQQFATVNVRLDIDGDYNDDHFVNVLDFNLWKSSYGQTGTASSLLADGNLNGIVDAADYTIWRNNLGKSLADLGLASGSGWRALSVGQGGAVPEPSALLLLISAVILLATRRSR